MRLKNSNSAKRTFVCILMTIPLLTVLFFGSAPENFFQGQVSGMADVRGFLEHGVFLLGADFPTDQSVSFDGKYMDWSVLTTGKNIYRESITDIDLSALAPISDTENATMRHTTYIINKDMKIFFHPGGKASDRRDGHGQIYHQIKERSC